MSELPLALTPSSAVHTTGCGPGEGTTSSFRIVATPCPSAIVADIGLDRFTSRVSSVSTVVSPLTVMPIVRLVTPGAKLKLLLAAT